MTESLGTTIASEVTTKGGYICCNFCGSMGGRRVRNKVTGNIVPITLKKHGKGYICQMCELKRVNGHE